MVNPTERMGATLQTEVERQLLEDLRAYKLESDTLRIDWSDAEPEERKTRAMDGELVNYSGVTALNDKGEVVAEGWIDFIHPVAEHPPFVFWNFLTILEGENPQLAKRDMGIPKHLWKLIPEEVKDALLKPKAYWGDDELVHKWKRNRRG